MKAIPKTWVDGSPLIQEERAAIAALREVGCDCDFPLLGYHPTIGPRCRLCNTIVKNVSDELNWYTAKNGD